MTVRWSAVALDDLAEMADTLRDAYGLAAADTALARVMRAATLLDQFPLMGRAGALPGTREWPVRRTPRILVYEVAPDGVYILRVRDARRRWPPTTCDD